MSTATPNRMLDRMLGALRLDAAIYEEIEADQKATGEAAFVVVASALVAGAGLALARGGAVNDGFLGVIGELIGWAAYAWFAWLVGTKLLPGPQTRSSWGELARTLGYASTPRFLLLLLAIPGLFGLVRLVVSLWRLAATIVALRSALDCGTGRAIVVAIAASIAEFVVVSFIIGALF
jgi:hypothetical protein